MTTMAMIAALVAVGFGIGQAVTGGGIVLLTAGAIIGVGAIALLVQINQVSTARAQLAQTVQPTRAAEVYEAERPIARQQPARTSWTPIPTPKPLYLSRTEAPVAQQQVQHLDTAAELQEAAARAERALRAAQEKATPIARPAPAAETPPNRFARMGIVEVDESGTPNLDEVLRRRRAV
jgi:hypothetical protein